METSAGQNRGQKERVSGLCGKSGLCLLGMAHKLKIIFVFLNHRWEIIIITNL